MTSVKVGTIKSRACSQNLVHQQGFYFQVFEYLNGTNREMHKKGDQVNQLKDYNKMHSAWYLELCFYPTVKHFFSEPLKCRKFQLTVFRRIKRASDKGSVPMEKKWPKVCSLC